MNIIYRRCIKLMLTIRIRCFGGCFGQSLIRKIRGSEIKIAVKESKQNIHQR